MDVEVVRNETFSGKDWALDEVERAHYEDCAFHDVDWSEAKLAGCTFTHCEFGNVRFNAAELTNCAITQSVLRRCSFFDATLVGCKLTGTQFLDCGLRPLTIDGGDWGFVSLRGANLTAARLGGLRLRDRWGGWDGEPYTGLNPRHVSVYELDPGS